MYLGRLHRDLDDPSRPAFTKPSELPNELKAAWEPFSRTEVLAEEIDDSPQCNARRIVVVAGRFVVFVGHQRVWRLLPGSWRGILVHFRLAGKAVRNAFDARAGRSDRP